MKKTMMCCTAAFLALSLFGAGCASAPKYTQAQLNAIETRVVDADLNETFNAVSNALFDAGYTIKMSDRQAGLITGEKAKDMSSARFWWGSYIKDIEYAISVHVRETSPKQCTVRIKTSENGEPQVNKEAIDQLWVLMQRQVLMKEPVSISKN
jgi:hypothetical protein